VVVGEIVLIGKEYMRRRLTVFVMAALIAVSGAACGVEDQIRDRANEEVDKQKQRAKDEVDKQKKRVEDEVEKKISEESTRILGEEK
jgi:DNA-binding PadR family transcriptional regulator